jgi:hypothetical protein
MDNSEYKRLEDAKRIILDENMEALDKSDIRVVSSKIETHSKYGPQCTIILQTVPKR